MRSVQVAGSGTDLLNGAIIHSKRETPTGTIQKSKATVELKGDLIERVLYHVTSTFNSASNILVNTGDQVFSGTIAGSEPVMIQDGRFSFHSLAGRQRSQSDRSGLHGGVYAGCG